MYDYHTACRHARWLYRYARVSEVQVITSIDTYSVIVRFRNAAGMPRSLASSAEFTDWKNEHA